MDDITRRLQAASERQRQETRGLDMVDRIGEAIEGEDPMDAMLALNCVLAEMIVNFGKSQGGVDAVWKYFAHQSAAMVRGMVKPDNQTTN